MFSFVNYLPLQDISKSKESMEKINTEVQDYYVKVLYNSEDFMTNACCTSGAPPENIRKALKNVHEEVKSKYYGCGLTIPHHL